MFRSQVSILACALFRLDGMLLPAGFRSEELPRCWCQTSPPVQHVIVGRSTRGKAWREGAGVVAIREAADGFADALVVNGKKNMLGFPKGGRKGTESALDNALREWREETGLDPRHLAFYNGIVLVEADFGCHYFLERWARPTTAGDKQSWRPPAEDPTDLDPSLLAQWLPLHELLRHGNFSRARKLLLRQAGQLLVALPVPTTSGTARRSLPRGETTGTTKSFENRSA